MDPRIISAKETTQRGHDRLLNTLGATHDDKLDWSPSSTSKSALGLVSHSAEANFFFAKVIGGEEIPPVKSVEDADEKMKAAAKQLTTRDQAVHRLEESVAALMAAIDKLSSADLDKDVVLPFRTMPMNFAISIPGMHMANHASQIDYIQTIYGDAQNHM
jgi:uncharacterized damage-inducible protein DinB